MGYSTLAWRGQRARGPAMGGVSAFLSFLGSCGSPEAGEFVSTVGCSSRQFWKLKAEADRGEDSWTAIVKMADDVTVVGDVTVAGDITMVGA